jgi:hypothetical protein
VAPFEGQQPAEQHEQNEQQMKQHQPIGSDSVKHLDSLVYQANRFMVLGWVVLALPIKGA